MALQKISKIVKLKPEPQTTPSLSVYIQQNMARECVSQYYLTPSLRGHFKRIFECVVHRQGQGFWVQAEYGAGKTHFLAAIVVLLMWIGEKVWDCLRDDELKQEYADALSKTQDVSRGLLAPWHGTVRGSRQPDASLRGTDPRKPGTPRSGPRRPSETHIGRDRRRLVRQRSDHGAQGGSRGLLPGRTPLHPR